MPESSPADIAKSLVAFDTCTVANAIEGFDIRLRNEGFNISKLNCRFPLWPPMVGFAATLRVRSGSPPLRGHSYLDRTDWWNYLQSLPLPHVLVIQDMDEHPGDGAFVGAVHAAILKAMGSAGVVTNGAVRDLPSIERMGLHLFSTRVSVSHAYAHVVEYGAPVEIAGLQIRPGDLLHGDQHGFLRVPLEIAGEIPKVAAALLAREQRIMSFCHSPDFSVGGLRELIGHPSEGQQA